MLRSLTVRNLLRQAQPTRSFTAAARNMAEGDTGGTRATTQQDAFSKREKASEDKYVRDQELAKLKTLREKLKAQQKSIDDLIDDIDDGSNGQKKK